MKPIILATTSPQRQELLAKLGLEFQAVPSNYKEDMDLKMKPAELAKTLSAGKAKSVISLYSNHVIIAADTFITLENEFLGKPHTEKAAIIMLKKISGQVISVITGLTVLETPGGKKLSRAVETKVYIKTISDDEIRSYVKTGEPLDKAGAFAIQGIGAVIVEKIEGDYYNVIGLPLFALSELLKEFGVKILH